MKKPARKTAYSIFVLTATVLVAVTACHPRSRESNQTVTPPKTSAPQQNPTEPGDSTAPNQPGEEPPIIDQPVTDLPLKDGDIIFHKSQSKQSSAIREASESEWTHVGILVFKNESWYVAEAIGPVVTTPLQEFINRGKDKEYKIYRYKYFDAATMKENLYAAIKKQNRAYDIYFEISDENTYCSELVYKAMLEVTGHEIGTVQQFKDLKLNGPFVKAMIKRRLTDKGRVLNPEEPIITPAAQMADPNLTLIKEFVKKEHL